MESKQQNVFEVTDKPRIRRSGFDLSHEYKTAHDFFDLIPISVVEAIPGDIHKIGVSSVLRFQPMLAPILHRLKMRFMTFFVPYRLVDDNWVDFITRNPDGDGVVTLPLFNPADYPTPSNVVGEATLWDYLGYPLVIPPAQACPLDYPRRAYYKIWNEFFRDENLESEIDYTTHTGTTHSIVRSAWQRDLFTAALPFRQKGTAPALPVFGSASVAIAPSYVNLAGSGQETLGFPVKANATSAETALGYAYGNVGGTFGAVNAATQLQNYMDIIAAGSSVDGSTFSSADISDLRLASQVQAWMERNARGGTRYTEFLWSQFNESPRDETLQRPVFVGAVTSDVLISEVLQTSEGAGTPQGNLAGHGLGLAKGVIGSYRVKEFGVMMTLATVLPNPAYQQGIDRAWLRRTTFDFPFPIFATLSEQEVFNAEIYTRDSTADPTGSINRTPFGYTGRYNELRFVPNKVTGQMRDTLDYWHLGRKFASAPSLNGDFVRPTQAEIDELKRVFAVTSEPGMIVSYGIWLNSYRPIPYMAIPSSMGGI